MKSYRRTAALLSLCLACGVLANDDGWNFTPIKGARSKDDAQMLALAASFEDGTDPRLPVWWASFKTTFYKKYPDAAAEDKAYKNFLANLDMIVGTNSDLSIPYWTTGNFYADYDYETFRQTFLMTNINQTQLLKGRRLLSDGVISQVELQARRRLLGTDVDWRGTGKLTPVDDQGGCGSCWAYAATAAIEAAYLIGEGQTSQQLKINLAEQQIIDCSGAGSCNGGGSDFAISYVANRFQVQQAIYPSTYKDGACQQNGNPPANQAVSLSAITFYPDHSEASIMAAVSKNPVVIYFEVVGDFFSYSGGIYRPSTCGTAINHAMVAVGYHYTGNPADSYWIIRNSWGGNWGQNGYIYVQMTGTQNGPCGMYNFVFGVPTDFDLTLPNGAPAPRAPGQPGQPGNPSTPGSPNAPGAPNAPGSPNAPGAPNAPGSPSTPDMPPPLYPYEPDAPAPPPSPRPPRRHRRQPPPPSPRPPRRHRRHPPPPRKNRSPRWHRG